MRLTVIDYLPRSEIVHYADDKLIVTSYYNTVTIKESAREITIQLPKKGLKHLFGHIRLFRRALRLDKCNVVPVDENNFVIIKEGVVYHYDKR